MKTRTRRTFYNADDLKSEVQRWALKIGVEPMRVQIQRMTTKWASCSPAGRICLSTDLLREDAAFLEVVVVHELLHLRVPNHGKLFKSLMNAYLPSWKETANGRVRSVCDYQDSSVSPT
jgi:predicted metal-dependent hydrolase